VPYIIVKVITRQNLSSINKLILVHPCVIKGLSALVYAQGLAEHNKSSFDDLCVFAKTNGLKLKENQRSISKNAVAAARSFKPVLNLNLCTKENKATSSKIVFLKTWFLFFISSSLCNFGIALAADNNDPDSKIKEMPEIEVTGSIKKDDRNYIQKEGKRFFTTPYGETASILAVASRTKAQGELKRVRTMSIKMPSNYIGSFINKYEHTFSNGMIFTYYEADGFAALGYHIDSSMVILDVMVGGGPFSSPKLWGPYDQILGDKDNSSMHMVMGNGSKDGMGLLKASYAIGHISVMTDDHYAEIGNIYSSAIQDTVITFQASKRTLISNNN
jgi:hypothetical protein